MTIWEIYREGGFIMLPLLICSIIIWAVLIERLWFIFKFKKQAAFLFSNACELVEEGKYNEMRGLCHSVHKGISGPFLTLVDGKDKPKDEVQGALVRRLKETQQYLKKYLWMLGTIASSAPFIGLFGTVVGIIKSFESISQSGKSGFSIVAGDLGEALIATAAGILVAVMAVIFYNFFQSLLNSTFTSFRVQLEDLREKFS